MKKIISLIAFCVGCGSVAAQTPYTLDQLKQLAVENNYALHSARNAIEQSKEQKSEAWTKYFPSVSAFGAGMVANKDLISMDINVPDKLIELFPALAGLPGSVGMMKDGMLGSVTAMQPVFMGGMIVNGNKLAKVGIEASEIQMEVSEDQVELTTEKYYWQMVTLKEKLKTLGAVHEMLETLEKDVTNMVRVGAVNRNDLLQVQLRKGDVESATLELENGLSTIGQLLAQHIGKSGETIDVAASVPTDGALTELPSRVDHQSALSATPEYRLLQKNVESHQLQRKLKVGQNMPNVAVGATYSANDMMESWRSHGMLFATVRVPITSWWGGSHAIKKQNLALEDAKAQMVDNGQKLVIRMNNAWAAVETSHKKLQIAHAAIAQAEENLRLNKDYYRVGSTKMTDLLQAQEQYQQACDRYTDAYATYQTKLLEYRQATGQ
jgi:outer membrane protein TolC